MTNNALPTHAPLVRPAHWRDSPGWLMRAVLIHMRSQIDARMAEIGLTEAQWVPILFLATGQASTAADLARCGMQTPAGVTRMLDRLEAKGLVQRERSSEDRRVINLVLTEAGQQAADLVPPVLRDVNAQALAGFSEAEATQFKQFLVRALLTLEGDTAGLAMEAPPLNATGSHNAQSVPNTS